MTAGRSGAAAYRARIDHEVGLEPVSTEDRLIVSKIAFGHRHPFHAEACRCITSVTMPIAPYDPTVDDEPDKELPRISDLIDRILHPRDGLRPPPG